MIASEDLETLRMQVSALARKADVATQVYERTAWIRYFAIFVPIPLAVLIFKLDMQAWHYYVAGALFLVVALVMYAVDAALVAKRDEAVEAAQRAHETYEALRRDRAAHV